MTEENKTEENKKNLTEQARESVNKDRAQRMNSVKTLIMRKKEKDRTRCDLVLVNLVDIFNSTINDESRELNRVIYEFTLKLRSALDEEEAERHESRGLLYDHFSDLESHFDDHSYEYHIFQAMSVLVHEI